MIFCPLCNGTSEVIDKRNRHRMARRRRKCRRCGHTWSTLEVSVELLEGFAEQIAIARSNQEESKQ